MRKTTKHLVMAAAAAAMTVFPSTMKAEDTTDVAYSFSPADGAAVDALEEFSITFEGAVDVDVKFTDYSFLTSLYNGETIYPQLNWWDGASEGKMIFYFYEPLHEEGTYEFVCPEGGFEITYPDGSVVPSPEITYTITTLGKVIHYVEWTSIPETFNFDAKLTEFTDVQFFFNEDATVTLGEPEGELEAIVNYQLYEAPLVDPDNITRLYYEEPIRTQSAVAILVPKGFWNLTFDDGQVIPSPDITAYFYVDSPTRITPTFIDEGESAEIYDMSGACIARKADKGTLRSLPAGIYLINGKKIIIR